ncbi:methylase [Halioglobus japonicus]|uniref:DUF938 domain-containing protein n=1 Tax=Halioglobus japonicus TaxID=930805 RepID=A0AAP8SMS1_9GAMM|nr:DUF938 domain-containing protein [Halioglobus japonicus]AQA17386.1 methylase [Halioglobus japonicus]PLW85308.1 DUF938 domain-containing protein [Halioglobus japonicus]GHD22419.1 methylase [Halioglobus japonicus]
MSDLPYSQACENNKDPILAVLRRVFADRSEVLEIASGTGQHATWFAEHMPHLHWLPTDQPSHLDAVRPRCQAYAGDNLAAPVALDVSTRPWSVERIPSALFTANSLHIMPWSSVCDLFAELGERAEADTRLAIYGPFNYGGEYTSPSNARFDQWLAQQSEYSAIRDFERVNELASEAGFELLEDNPMPANNRLIVWSS